MGFWGFRVLRRFGRLGDSGDWEIGRLGDWEIGRLGHWEIGRLGDWEIREIREIGRSGKRRRGEHVRSRRIGKLGAWGSQGVGIFGRLGDWGIGRFGELRKIVIYCEN